MSEACELCAVEGTSLHSIMACPDCRPKAKKAMQLLEQVFTRRRPLFNTLTKGRFTYTTYPALRQKRDGYIVDEETMKKIRELLTP